MPSLTIKCLSLGNKAGLLLRTLVLKDGDNEITVVNTYVPVRRTVRSFDCNPAALTQEAEWMGICVW